MIRADLGLLCGEVEMDLLLARSALEAWAERTDGKRRTALLGILYHLTTLSADVVRVRHELAVCPLPG